MSVRFSTVEQEIMDDVFNPETLVKGQPRLSEVVEGAQMLREIIDEVNAVGKYQRANGFLADGSMQRVCKYDTDIQLAMEEFHRLGCTCGREVMGFGGHKEWFYLWLNGPGKAFDVRGQIKV